MHLPMNFYIKVLSGVTFIYIVVTILFIGNVICFVCLFDLILYVQGKQLRSCQDGMLLYHTVPEQASRRQFINIKSPYV